jgi:DNA-binding response OmpR family regulator
VPILVLTFDDHPFAAGADAVCVKPCYPDALLEQIRKLLAKPANTWVAELPGWKKCVQSDAVTQVGATATAHGF